MKDTDKTKNQLIQELGVLRQRVAEAEASGAERKLAESQRDATLEALRDSESQYRTTLDAMGDMIHVVDDNLQIVLFNDALRQRNEELGLEADIVGKTIHELYPFLSWKVLKEYDEVFKSGRLLVTEGCNQVGDKEIITETRKIPIRGGDKVAQVITVIRDITERKRAESQRIAMLEALRESEGKFRSIIEQSADGIVLADERGIIVEWNQAQEQVTSLKRTEALGKPVWDVLDQVFPQERQNPATHEHNKATTIEFLRTGQATWLNQLTEGEVERSDGTRRNVQAITFPIKTNKGFMSASIIRDITERKQAEEEIHHQAKTLAAAALENNRLLRDLQQQMDKLKETQAQLVQAAKLAGIGELAAGVAHELNNPLTSILGFAQLLLNATPPDAPARSDLEIIANQARRGRDIVRNLLDFARQTKPQRLPADVNQVLYQTLDLIRQYLEKSGVVIEEDYAPDVGLLTLDSAQMKQVLLNLITNAAQAMPKGGKLRLRTVCVGSEVAISVSDTGQGISSEIQERIFEPFFTTKATGEGTGLGLSVSLGIVREHGGRITVESQAERGSTFTVWLPAERGIALN